MSLSLHLSPGYVAQRILTQVPKENISMEICHWVVFDNKMLETTTYYGSHFVIYMCIRLSYYTLLTYTMLYVSFISMNLKKNNKLEVDEDLS